MISKKSCKILFTLFFILMGLSLSANSPDADVTLRTGESIVIEATSCSPGFRSAVSVLPLENYQGQINLNKYSNGGYAIVNKLRASVTCLPIECILVKDGWPWQNGNRQIALTSEGHALGRFLTKFPISKDEAETQIQNLIRKQVCTQSRKRRQGKDWVEKILPYEEGFPHNIH